MWREYSFPWPRSTVTGDVATSSKLRMLIVPATRRYRTPLALAALPLVASFALVSCSSGGVEIAADMAELAKFFDGEEDTPTQATTPPSRPSRSTVNVIVAGEADEELFPALAQEQVDRMRAV